MRISDWSSDVCSSDLCPFGISLGGGNHIERYRQVRVGNGRTLNFLGNLRTNSGLALLHQCSFLRLHSGAALQQRPSDAKDQHESNQQRRQVPRALGNPARLIPFLAKSYRIGSYDFAGRTRHALAASLILATPPLEQFIQNPNLLPPT